MANDVSVVTRTVVCPRCRADATLSYTADCSDSEQSRARQVVYLCPNMCVFAPDEISAFLTRDA